MNFKIERRDDVRGFLVIECTRGYEGQCRFCLSMKTTTPNHVWAWNGSIDRPTLQPSVVCQGGCGRHFELHDGKVIPDQL